MRHTDLGHNLYVFNKAAALFPVYSYYRTPNSTCIFTDAHTGFVSTRIIMVLVRYIGKKQYWFAFTTRSQPVSLAKRGKMSFLLLVSQQW